MRGPRGFTGRAGRQGKPGVNHTDELTALSNQMDQIVRELQTQLKRMAQMQLQLDHLAGFAPNEPSLGEQLHALPDGWRSSAKEPRCARHDLITTPICLEDLSVRC